MSHTRHKEVSSAFLGGGGEMGRLMRAHDWSGSPLGAPESWPQPLKTLVEVMLAANQPMFVAWGPERTLLYNNPYIEVLASKHPAFGHDFLDVWDEIRADLAPLVERAYGGEPSHSQDIELLMVRKGYPEETHFAYSYTPVRDETGAVAGLFCSFIEITEQVLARRRLAAERERQWRMLQQMPGFAALLSGPEHRYAYVNDAYVKISGPRDFIGRGVREVFPEIAGQGFYELLDRVYATGERFEARTLPIRLAGDDGERFVDLVYEPIRDDDGAVTGIFVGGYDVTESARAERTLRHSEARYRGVVDGMAEGFGLLGPDFTLLELNAEAMRMETRPREAIVGQTHWDAYPGSEESEVGRLYKQAMAKRTPVALEHRYAWEDGRSAWLDMRAYPMADGGLAVFYRDVTDRKLAETELRDTEERLRLAVDNAEIGFWDVDVVNTVLIWPSRTKAMFGISPDVPVTMQDFYDGLHPDDRLVTSEAYAAAADPGRRALYDVEYRTVGKEDGVVRWVAAKGRGVFDDAGRCLRVAGTAIEITARKAVEARLRESEARFRLMADAVPQIVWIIGQDGRLEFFNKQWADYIGAPDVPTTAGDVATKYVHPDDEAATMAAFGEAQRTGRVFEVEHRIRRKDGTYRWFLVRAEPYRDPHTGDIARWFGASVDIHDRRFAEERLRELNETLELQVAARSAERDRLWNLSQDMLARADYLGMMSSVSPAWTQVLGWSEIELLSRPYATFMHPDDMPPTLEAIRRMSQTRLPTRFENRIATRDGAWKHIEWTVTPEPDGVNFIAIGRDISPSKKREADLAAAQDALRQSQKMEAMGQLTGGVAHDFNNLLTPIIGSLDMLVRRGGGSERERRLIDGALQSAERAKMLVQRLLAFARRQPLQPVAVDVGRLVDGMAGLIGSTLGPTIDIRFDIAPGLPAAKADPNQLEMALLNLAVNARDAMPEGGELTIAAKCEVSRGDHASAMEPGRYVQLSVSDTGVGMDEATRARAIEPFFSTKGLGKGTGLGLSMVHGLAAQLGGGLTIDSAPNRGTRIELWLPISPNGVGGDIDPTPAPLPRAGRGTALLVDDEELVRMSTADMLIDLGFEVIEAGSADEALQHIKSGVAPDLLVTDHLMPGMTGADLAREARTLQPSLPVLIVSGYAEAEGIAPELPRLTKPFRNAELAARVASLIPAADA